MENENNPPIPVVDVDGDASGEAGDEAAALSGDGGGGGQGGKDRVKGPWSPEEDAILSRLVGKFGARNWSLIARGIPGRSGKSCRLRWCNQLDPALKRKPFTGIVIMFLFFQISCMVNSGALLHINISSCYVSCFMISFRELFSRKFCSPCLLIILYYLRLKWTF